MPLDPSERRNPIAPVLRWLLRWEMVPVLLFVLLFKLGDSLLGRMVKPFWVDRGYSLKEIGLISVTLGVALTIAGALAGGWFVKRYGIFRALLWLGIAQAVTNLGYAAVAELALPRESIYAASLLESFTQGLGTVGVPVVPDEPVREGARGDAVRAAVGVVRPLPRRRGRVLRDRRRAVRLRPVLRVHGGGLVPGLLLLPLVRSRIREHGQAPAAA